MEATAVRQLGAVVFSHHELPPTDAAEAEDRDLAVVRPLAPRFAKRTGSGIMAVFDAASRAVDAAVWLQHDAVVRGAAAGPGVGLGAGELVIADDDVYGMTVVEAARLAHLAGPGTVLATARTGRSAGRPLEDHAKLSLRGIPEAVPCGTVLWKEPPTVREALGVPALLDVGTDPFVGRVRELEVVRGAVARGLESQPGVCIVRGEPGAGKTRLVAQALHGLDDAVVLLGPNDEFLDLSFEPVRRMVARVGERDPRGLGALGPHPEHLLPLVPSLLDRFPWLEALDADESTSRRRMLRAVDDWLVAASDGFPLVLVLDDLQWASPSTLGMLARVVRTAASLPVAVLATVRTGPVGAHVQAFLDNGSAEGWRRVELDGLSADEVAELDARLGDVDRQAEARAIEIAARSGGNPYLVRELIAASAEGTTPSGAPSSASELVERRLSQLAEEVRDTLRMAAVIGLDFEPAVLASALDRPLDDVLDAIESALDAQLLRERTDGTRLVLSFAHALTRDALYEGISRLKRARHHARVADALAGTGASNADLARHYRVAASLGRVEEAIRFTKLAGDDAREAHDAATAAKLYGLARELLDDHEVDLPRLDIEVDIGRGQALRRLGDPGHLDLLYATVDRAAGLGMVDLACDGILSCYRGSFRQAFHVDDAIVGRIRRVLALDGADDVRLRALLLGCLAVELAFDDDPDAVRATVEEAIAAADRTGDDWVIARVLLMVRWALNHPIGARAAITDRAEDIARRRGDPRLLFFATDASALSAELLGDGERMHRLLAEALDLAAQIDESDVWWNASRLESKLGMLAGEREGMLDVIVRGHELGSATAQSDAGLRRASEQFWLDYEHGPVEEQVATLRAMIGAHRLAPREVGASFLLRYLDVGLVDEASAVYDDLADGVASRPHGLTWLWSQAIFGIAAAQLGRHDDVERLLALLSPHREHTAAQPFATVGAVARTLGHLHVARGDHDVAHRDFELALELNESVRARTFVVRSHLDLAASHLRLGRGPDDPVVAEHLDAVARGCDELDLPLVRHQRDLLVASVT